MVVPRVGYLRFGFLVLVGGLGVGVAAPVISGHVARTTGVHDPPVLQASDLHISSETKGEQMSQHWG